MRVCVLIHYNFGAYARITNYANCDLSFVNLFFMAAQLDLITLQVTGEYNPVFIYVNRFTMRHG